MILSDEGRKFLGPDVPLARYSKSDVVALQALSTGEADEYQQKRALKWIIEGACAMYEWANRETERGTLIQIGRQTAGHQIVGLLKQPIEDLKE